MRSAGFIAGWLGAALAVVGGCAEKPAGTFDEADVHAWLEEWRDARQTADRGRTCALRGKGFTMIYTEEPSRPEDRRTSSEFDRDSVCRLPHDIQLGLPHRLELLTAQITMTNDGKGARVAADFRNSIPGHLVVTELQILFILGEEAGKLVSLREDIRSRRLELQSAQSPPR